MRIVWALALCLLLASCAQQSTTSDTIRIGAIIPFSGPTAEFGVDLQRGLELAKDELAAQGYNIEIIYEDSKGTPRDGVAAYQRLSTVENVDVVITFFSRVSIPIIPLAEQDSIPLIMTAVSADDVAATSPYAYRFFIDTEGLAKNFLDFASQKEFSKLGVIYLNDEAGVSNTEGLKRAAKEIGIEVVQEQPYESTSNDFRSQLTQIQNSEADLLVINAPSPVSTIGLLQQTKELGIELPVYEYPGVLAIDSIRSRVAQEAEGVYSFNYQYQYQKNAFLGSYEQRYNVSAPYFGAFGYDILYWFSEYEQTVLAAQPLQDHSWTGVNGEYVMNADGDVLPPITNVQVRDGELVQLE